MDVVLSVSTAILAIATIGLGIVTWINANKTQHVVDETREAREIGAMPVIRCTLVHHQGQAGTYHRLEVSNVGNSPAFNVELVLETINKDVASRIFPRTELELGTIGLEEQEIPLSHPDYVDERKHESRVSIRVTYQNIYKRWVVTSMEAVQEAALIGGGQWYWKSHNERVEVMEKGQKPESRGDWPSHLVG